MLDAVNMGRSRSDRLVLSRRRSMRRLRWANCRCNLVFTRNPFLLVVDGVWLHHQTPQNPKDFEFLQNPPSPPHGEFAWLRPSLLARRLAHYPNSEVR